MVSKQSYLLSIAQAFDQFKTSQKGLAKKEAERRKEHFGENVLPEEKKISKTVLLVRQFKSVLVYILLIAAIISLILHDEIDAYIILAAVLINVIVGYFQEDRAQNALAALKKVITLKAKVIREGEELEVDAREIVPGDIVILAAGDKIPADGRIIEENNLYVNEASLTGESRPQEKTVQKLNENALLADRKNMLYFGTNVVEGLGKMVVCAIGQNTEIGKIAVLMKETKEDKTPLQIRLAKFSRFLGVMTLGICLFILIIGLAVGMEFVEIFTVSVALAVAAIPEGLAVAVTIILAIGMQRILKRRALTRKLLAAETLGSTTVICTDKTGTVTEGDMRVVKVVTLDHDFSLSSRGGDEPKITGQEGQEVLFALKIGMLCNDASVVKPEDDELGQPKILGNLTERALMGAAMNVGFDKEEVNKETPRLSGVPFDSTRKYMLTLHKLSAKENMIYMKGAAEKMLDMSSWVKVGEEHGRLTDKTRKKIERKAEAMSRKGLRIIAVGYKRVPKNIVSLDLKEKVEDGVFAGLIGIQDPLRPEAKSTVALCKQAGIRTVMITGDHPLTAMAIAKELGLKFKRENVLTGEDMDRLSDKQLASKVKNISVYARVSPEDKIRIIDAWQENGEVVAMTGDGVNDAPALKSAHIGVALGSGTDVAKEASDLVILDDNFSTIVAAVEQGRVIYDNIKKVSTYLLSDSFSEVLLVASALVFGLPLPLLASQILWINLVTDGFPDIALTQEPKEKGIMKEPPRRINASIIGREGGLLIALISFFTGMGNLVLFYIIWTNTQNIELARTIIFVSLGLNTLLYVFSLRSLRHSVFHEGFFSNRWLILAVGGGIALQLMAIYFEPLQEVLRTVPLGFWEWMIIIIFGMFIFCLIEIFKFFFFVRPLRRRLAKA